MKAGLTVTGWTAVDTVVVVAGGGQGVGMTACSRRRDAAKSKLCWPARARTPPCLAPGAVGEVCVGKMVTQR